MPLVGQLREGRPSSGPQTIPELLAYLRARKIMDTERTRKAGLEEREMGLAEAVGQAQIGERGARAQALRQPKVPTSSEQIKQLQLQYLMQLSPEKRDEVINAMVTKPVASIMLGKPASAGERTDIADARTSLDHLNNLKNLFDEQFVGPLTGRVAPMAGLVNMTSQQQERFMAATSAFKNAIIKQITGAQMSEPEAKRIMKQVPDITDPVKRWKAKWEESKKNIQAIERRRLEILGQSGLKVPVGEQGQQRSEPYSLEGIMGTIPEKRDVGIQRPQTPTRAPSPKATPVAEGKVKVQAPDGRIGLIPKSQLKEALKQGYKLVNE